MTQKARLRFSKAARSDLLQMRRYSLERYGRAVATRYVDDVEAAFRLLQEQPQAGRPHLAAGADVRCFTKRRHRVFYRIEDEVVHILRVLHHAMDARPAIDGASG